MNEPTEDDFEARLRTLMTERVDAEAGPRRPAPPFEPPQRRRGDGGRPTWLMPLLAAAAVVAVVAGGAGVSAVLANGGTPAPPATHAPTSSPRPRYEGSGTPTPPDTSPVRSSPSTHRSSPSTQPYVPPVQGSTHSSTHPPTGAGTVQLDGARIALPSGWTAAKQDTGSNSYPRLWCLHDPSQPHGTCAVTVYEFGTDATSLDVDRHGFNYGDPPQYVCGNATSTETEQLASGTFGGQQAEVRTFRYHCAKTGRTSYAQQIVVPTAPSFGLEAESATPATLQAIHFVATRSTLPASTGTLRLFDRGTVRAATPTAGGVAVRISRVAVDAANGKVIDAGPATYRYVVPTSLYERAKAGVGSAVTVRTDGTKVTGFEEDPLR